MTESDIITVKCPLCGEVIPVRIDLKGRGVDEGLVESMGSSTEASTPFPIVEYAIDLDLEGLKDGGLDELIKEKRRVDEIMARPFKKPRKARKPVKE